MMFTFLRLLAASAVVIPTFVSASPSATSPLPFNPTELIPVHVPFVGNILEGVSLPNPAPETNAQRMKRGLGPKKPNFKHPKRALYPRQSSTPCTAPAGFIRVQYVDGDGAEVDGFLGAVPNEYGEYSFVESQDSALRVQLNSCASNGAPFDIYTLVRNALPLNQASLLMSMHRMASRMNLTLVSLTASVI